MKTKSNKKQNLLILGFLVVVLVALVVFFGACNKEDYFNKYGKANAFNKTSYGNAFHIDSNRIDFYIDSSVTGTYLTATKHAIAQANSATNNLTVTANGSKNSKFKFSVAWSGEPDYEGLENALGVCYWRSVSWNGNINSAEIVFYDDNFPWWYWSTFYKHTAIHELGHLLGLDHVNSLPTNETIMESVVNFPISSFTEFDIANLQWMYDNGGRELYD